MIAAGGTVGPAEGIIDDACLVLLYIQAIIAIFILIYYCYYSLFDSFY